MAERESPHIVGINDANFEREVLGSNGTFLLEFATEWCRPCKMLAPIVETIARESEGQIRVGKIDMDDAPNVSVRLGVRAVPTVVVFKDGKEHRRHVGLTTKAKLLDLMPDSAGRDRGTGDRPSLATLARA